MWLSGLDCLTKPKVTNSPILFLVRAHARVLGLIPSGDVEEAEATDRSLMFLSLSPSLLLSIKINK